MVGGEEKTLLVHRKGSTRAFPPHHPLIPVDYQLTGQPVLIGGTMGTHSYVLTGAPGLPLSSLSSLIFLPAESAACASVLAKHSGRCTRLSSWMPEMSREAACPERVCCVQGQRRAWQRLSGAPATEPAAPPAATAPGGTWTTRRCAALRSCPPPSALHPMHADYPRPLRHFASQGHMGIWRQQGSCRQEADRGC